MKGEHTGVFMSVILKTVITFLAFSPMAWSQMIPQVGGMMRQPMSGQPMVGPNGELIFYGGMMQMQQYMQVNGAAMNGQNNCLGRATQNFSQSLSQSYEAHNQRTNLLMQNATTRFEHLKTCRQELLDVWREMEKAKLAHQQNANQLQTKIRQAELEYKTKVLEVERECRRSSNEEFVQYRDSIYQQSVVADPTMLPGFNQRINNHRRNFFETCYRDPTNVKMLGLLGESFQASILEIETELKNSRDALQNMDLQARSIQKNSLQNCEDQDKLNTYNEALSRQMASRAINMTRMQSALGTLQTVASCVDPGRQPGSNQDTTRGRPTSTGL